jgi:hypothetical protein
MTGVKSKALEKLHWGRLYKGKLWAMVGPDGKEAKSGSPIDDMATLNKKGLKAADIIAMLEEHGSVCRDSNKKIQAEITRVGGKCATVEKALKAASGKQNERLGAYSREVDNAKKARGQIQAAQSEIETALKGLENAKKKLEKFKVDSLKDKKEKELQTVKASRDAAIASITEILDLAKLVRGGNLVDMADTAINKIAIHIVNVDYEPKLKALTKKVDDLNKKSAELAKEIALGEVATAASQFKAAYDKYKVQEINLNNSLKRAAEARKLAMDILDQRAPTTGLADIMDDRTKHTKFIELTKRNIAIYKTGLEKAMKDLSSLERSYSIVNIILKNASKKEKSYGPDSAYGKAAYKWGLENSVLLGKWSRYAKNEVAYCKEEDKYLNDNGAQGPFAGFNKIQQMIDEALKTRRKTLIKHGLKC